MLAAQNQVYQNLANLVRWADSLLLQGVGLMNKENADVTIKSLIESIEVSGLTLPDTLRPSDIYMRW